MPLGIAGDHVHPFMATMYPTSHGYLHHDHAQCHKASSLKLVSWTWQWVQCSSVTFQVTWYESNRKPLGCGQMGDLQHACAANTSAEIVWCNHVNKEQNLKEMSTFCGIHAIKNWGCFIPKGGPTQYWYSVPKVLVCVSMCSVAVWITNAQKAFTKI